MALNAIQLDTSGDLSLLYNFFYVENYTGTQAYSSYALPITPVNFKPVLNDGIEKFISNKTIRWDFGDGTTSSTVSASHAYSEPGRYKVTCYLYDGDGVSYYDIYNAYIDIVDYVQDELIIRSDTDISHVTGKLLNPITVKRYNSARSISSGGLPTITPYISSGLSTDYGYFSLGLDAKTYGHLYSNFTFFQYLTTAGVSEPLQVDTIKTEDTNIYVKLSNSNQLVHTTSNDPDAVFAGISGSADIYFKSDIVGNFNLLFGYDTGDIFKYTNTTTYGIAATITENTSYDKLAITSNGIDGEGSALNVFDINDTKFANTNIAFVVRAKDSDYFTQKNMPRLSATSTTPLNLVLVDGSGVTYDVEFTSNFLELSSLETGGFYKGVFKTTNTTTLENVFLSGNYTHDSNLMTGTSNTFSIYPSSYYVIAKQGEDIDFTDTFKDIATQPLFNTTPILMNDFLGSIFGSLSSAQDSIGKSTYEKIKNFQDNNTIIDYANIDQLASILESLDLKSLNKFSIPPKLSRLVDLLSISKSRLFGAVNLNQQNYNTFGYANSEFYGANLGTTLTINSSAVPGTNIVAFEKYSGRYIELNTFSPLSASSPPNIRTLLSTKFYILSDYNDTWGWPLLSGDGRDIFDIYTFYEQISSSEERIGSVINFSDGNTTLPLSTSSYTDWSKDNGIVSNILANALYDGLELF
tara:strand:- start:3618 stop:5699 length:2082 start_codon:yes stop_codon:yes gene_type:complete